MRIAAMAAGAVGSYFGGRLQAAGHDVAYIARRANLEALKKDGLKIQSVHGDLHLPKVFATPDPKEVGPVDIVLFAVKLWDTEIAAELAREAADSFADSRHRCAGDDSLVALCLLGPDGGGHYGRLNSCHITDAFIFAGLVRGLVPSQASSAAVGEKRSSPPEFPVESRV